MDGLQLSEEMINELQQSLTKFDERAKDSGIAVQYYAAIIGYVVGQQNFAYQDKKNYIEQLGGFMLHVMDDVANPSAEHTPGEGAFGIWKPGDA